MGSDANSSLPQAITAARAKHGIDFKAGHLLNADFFGDGQDSQNLTILTPSANSSMRGFDNSIKEAVRLLLTLYEALHGLGVDTTPLRYGIRITITVSAAKWGSDYPDNCIANKVKGAAAISGDLGALTPEQDARIDRIRTAITTLVERANAAGAINNRRPRSRS